jgi:hypothetical protein
MKILSHDDLEATIFLMNVTQFPELKRNCQRKVNGHIAALLDFAAKNPNTTVANIVREQAQDLTYRLTQ